ncbi:V-type ATP synthase subunit D [bacterium]
MARYKVVPTKTNLMKLRRERTFAQEGYDLLEQKRQILLVELMGLMDKTADAQEQTEKNWPMRSGLYRIRFLPWGVIRLSVQLLR